MTEPEKKDVSEILQILIQLDKESLLLIDSGIRLLAKRQNLETEKNEDR
ncbi:MAG: hypothetical protein K2J90_09295 [Lachnospiraceae bacterium]|nr:hypothetical protein [Lachnospiraceae bacterium]